MIIHFASETGELNNRPLGANSSSGFSQANLGQINFSQPTSLLVLIPNTKNNLNICLVLGPELETKTGSKLVLATL